MEELLKLYQNVEVAVQEHIPNVSLAQLTKEPFIVIGNIVHIAIQVTLLLMIAIQDLLKSMIVIVINNLLI